MTELITGVDLVEQMIRVAAGEKLAITQERREAERLGGREPRLRRGPLRATSCPPRAGSSRYRPPAEGVEGDVTVRNDTGVYEGGEISIYYDPMIAKLVTHAPTRARGDRRAGARRSTPSPSTASATTSRSSPP